jgi:hypothetical protein
MLTRERDMRGVMLGRANEVCDCRFGMLRYWGPSPLVVGHAGKGFSLLFLKAATQQAPSGQKATVDVC